MDTVTSISVSFPISVPLGAIQPILIKGLSSGISVSSTVMVHVSVVVLPAVEGPVTFIYTPGSRRAVVIVIIIMMVRWEYCLYDCNQ